MTEFQIQSVERLPKIGFLGAELRTIRTPDGESMERVVITHPGAVAVVPIDGDEVVLIRQYRAAIDAELLEIPAGKRDAPEEPPETTARRELQEELGIAECSLELLTSIVNAPGYADEVIDIFLARDLVFAGSVAPDGAEEVHSTIERMNLKEAQDAARNGTIRDAKTIIGLLLLP